VPSSDEIKSESSSLSEFCKDNNRYDIPLYQREYDWETTQLDEFWTDLINHIDEPETEKYFFGTVILVKENTDNHIFTIVDGQQRLSTSIIFITALRDFMDEKIKKIEEKIANLDSHENKPESEKKELVHLNDQKYDYRDDLKTLEKMIWIKNRNDEKTYQNRLSLNLYNDEFFRKVILSKKTLSEKFTELNELEKIKKKDEKIKNCYVFFYNKILEIDSSELIDPIRRIRTIWESFIDEFILTEITINNLDHAFKIFENINHKGKRLATNNLVKNKLYEIIASEYKNDRNKQMEILSQVDKNWQEMVSTLEDTRSKHATEDKFLKNYLTAFIKPTTSSDVYKRIKQEYQDQKSSIELIEQLAKMSGLFANIVKPTIDDWDEDIVDNLKSLSVMSDGALYPIILLANSYKFKPEDMRLLIRFLTKFFFRVKTVCEINFSYLEPLVNDVCIHIRKNGLSTDMNELMDMMTSKWPQYPQDDEFKIRFKTKDYANNIARYPLKEIHYHKTGKKETNTTKIKDNADVEHIMPQTLSQDWKDVIITAIVKNKKDDAIKSEQKKNPKYDLNDIKNMIEKQEFSVSEAEIDEYQSQKYKKLGNLTLLNTFKNKEILNFSFATKCKKYKTDDLDMTKKLTGYNEWDGETISQRLDDFTNDALEIWDLINNRK
jgi:uncharacterized protein with ParB-like and HNH nuclease domain